MTPIRIKSQPWSCDLVHLFPSCTHTLPSQSTPFLLPFLQNAKLSHLIVLHLLSLLPRILLPNKTFWKDWLLKSSASRSLFRCISCLSVHRIVSKHVIGICMHLLYKIFKFSVTSVISLVWQGLFLLHIVTFPAKPMNFITTVLENELAQGH